MTNSLCVDLGFGRRDGKRVMGRENIPNARITHINHWIGQYYQYQLKTGNGTQTVPSSGYSDWYKATNAYTMHQIPV